MAPTTIPDDRDEPKAIVPVPAIQNMGPRGRKTPSTKKPNFKKENGR